MYTKHFKLKEKPFSLIPGGEDIFLSPGHLAAFSAMEFGLLEQSGITVITGEVGAGKTTLIRHLLGRIDYEKIEVGLVATAHRTYGSLLNWIINAFRIPVENESDDNLLRQFQDFLIDRYAEGKRSLVIVDEAQNMNNDDLESLRLLTNINADKDQLLQIILVGQPELLERFQDPRMAQLAQRVSSEFNLQPLDLEETTNYVRHRLKSAGGNGSIFDESALQAIYYYSGGIPRIINTLCDSSLVIAYGESSESVNLEIVLDVVRNKQIGGIHRRGLESDPGREQTRSQMIKQKGLDLRDLVM